MLVGFVLLLSSLSASCTLLHSLFTIYLVAMCYVCWPVNNNPLIVLQLSLLSSVNLHVVRYIAGIEERGPHAVSYRLAPSSICSHAYINTLHISLLKFLNIVNNFKNIYRLKYVQQFFFFYNKWKCAPILRIIRTL